MSIIDNGGSNPSRRANTHIAQLNRATDYDSVDLGLSPNMSTIDSLAQRQSRNLLSSRSGYRNSQGSQVNTVKPITLSKATV